MTLSEMANKKTASQTAQPSGGMSLSSMAGTAKATSQPDTQPTTPQSTGSTVHESAADVPWQSKKASDGISFQQRMAQAEYERKKQEGILVDDERTTAQNRRQSLIDELGQIEANSGYVTDEQTANAQAARRQAIVDELHSLDDQLGNPAQAYTQSDRVGSVFGGWAQRRGGNDLNALLTIGRAAGEAQARAQLNSADQFLVDQMLGEDTRARAQEYEDAIHSDEYNAQWDKAYAVGDRWAAAGNQNLAYAKEGVNGAGRLAIDLGVGALDLAGDAVVNAVAPGAGQVAMATRVFGEAAREQRLKGGSQEQQLLAGTKAAAIEVLTEKIGGPFEKLYGKTLTGKMINTALDGIDNKVIRKALDMAADAFGEAAEEMLSDLANPVADYLLGLDDELKSWKDVGQSYDIQEILYDGLVGGILGLAGSATQVMGQGGQITPEQAAQIKEQAAQSAIQAVERKVAEYRAIYENSNGSTAAANAILRDPAALQSYIDQYGELQGKSRSEQAREIAANLRGEDVVQTPVEPVQTPRERMADQGVPTVDRPRGPAGPTQNEANVQQANQMRDTVLDFLTNPDAKPSAAREIVDDPKLRAVYEALTGETLPDSRNKAKQQVLDRAKSDNPAPNEATADITSVLFGNEADQTGADATAFIQGLQNQNQPAPATAQEQTAPATEQPAQNGQRPVVEANTAEEYAERNFATETPQNRAQTMDADEGIPASTTTTERVVAKPQELNSRPANPATQQTAQTAESGTPRPSQSGQAQTEQASQTQQTPSNQTGVETDGKKLSKFWTNTLQKDENAENLPANVKQPLWYLPKSEKQSLAEAASNLAQDEQGTVEKLIQADAWSGVQTDEAYMIKQKLRAQAKKSGDWTAYSAWREVERRHLTATGQGIQAVAKQSRGTGEAAVDNAVDQLSESDLPESVQNEIIDEVSKYADEFDGIEEGDTESLKDLIMRLAKRRKNWTIIKENLAKSLDKQSESWMRNTAYLQIEGLTRDALNRGAQNIGNKVASYHVLSMLSGLPTVGRNSEGNLTFGLVDLFSANGPGRAIDALVGKLTGQRLVVGSRGPVWKTIPAWFKNAWSAMETNMLETALDVSADERSRPYGMTANSAFVADSNPIERMFQRWSQFMSYALTSTDRFFRGGIETGENENYKAFDERRAAKGKSGTGLTAEEQQAASERTADYRLFQNKSAISDWAKANRRYLNNLLGFGGEIDENGNRVSDNTFGLGSLTMPFIEVPTNLAMKSVEYGPANLAKGTWELVQLMKAVHENNISSGDTKQSTAELQQRAVMDTARGLTGTGLLVIATALAKAGLIRNGDDEDDYNVASVNSITGQSGTQINLSAIERSLRGEGTEWRDGDTVMGMAGISPLDIWMNAGTKFAELDDDASALDYGEAYLQGTISSILDIPMFSSMAEMTNTLREAESITLETAGKLAGDAIDSWASGFVPQFIRQSARAADPYVRDTSGDNWLQERGTNLAQYIPGLRNTLPAAVDSFGNPKAQQDAANRWVNYLISPNAFNEIKKTPEIDMLEMLREATGKSSFYPERKAPNSVGTGDDKVELTSAQKREFQEARGQAYADAVSALMDADGWDDLTDEQKVSAIQKAKTEAKHEAEAAFYESIGSEATPSAEGWEKLDAGERTLYLVAKAGSSELYDKDGNIVDYGAMDKYLKSDAFKNLSDDARAVLTEGKNLSRLDNMYEASKLGITSEQYDTVYKKWKELGGSDAKDTSDAEALKTFIAGQKGLTKKQKDWLADDVKFWRQIPVDTETMDKFTTAGVKAESAQKLAESFRDINPVGDYKTVQNSQKYQAIASAKYLSDAEKWAAFFALMNSNTEKCEQQARRAKDNGYTYDYWAANSEYAVVKQQKGK